MSIAKCKLDMKNNMAFKIVTIIALAICIYLVVKGMITANSNMISQGSSLAAFETLMLCAVNDKSKKCKGCLDNEKDL